MERMDDALVPLAKAKVSRRGTRDPSGRIRFDAVWRSRYQLFLGALSRCAAVVALMHSSSVASSQSVVIARCGPASGHAVFPEQALVPKEKSGWVEDGMKDGAFFLVQKSASVYDIVYRDATTRTKSTSQEGGRIRLVSSAIGHMVFVVEYPAESTETWYFRLDETGSGDLTFSQARYGANLAIVKHSLLRAPCSR
jgi:hypothetical protein